MSHVARDMADIVAAMDHRAGLRDGAAWAERRGSFGKLRLLLAARSSGTIQTLDGPALLALLAWTRADHQFPRAFAMVSPVYARAFVTGALAHWP
jgi:hypothetical protein